MAEAGIDVSTRQGLSIAVASDVPLGAGLSSSAALECSVALALNDLWGLSLSRSELAALGQKAENEVVGANTGMMDQMASMFALENHAVFLDCRVGEVQSIPLSLGDLGIVVMDTMVSHQLAHSQYGARRASCEKAAEFFGVSALRDVTPAAIEGARGVLDEETLRRARHIVSENQRVLGAVEALGNGNLVGFGILLNQSHESMRDDFEISSPELDLAVACARDVGALGARMTGGGFGGSAIALLRADQMETLASTLTREFTGKSFAVPQPTWVSASTGARKEPDPER
jgi:galactokinase